MLSFQNALQIDPNEPAALKGLGQCGKKLGKKRKEENRVAQKAARIARKLVREEKWLDAIDQLNFILAKIPGQSDALKIRNEIEAKLLQKMSSDSKGVEPLIFQGILLYLQKQYEDAMKIWKEASTMTKDSFKVSVYIERALRTLKESRRQDIFVSGKARAKAAFSSGNFEEAAGLWKEVLEYDPKDEEAKTELAKSQEMQDKSGRVSVIGEHYDRGLSLFMKGSYADSMREWESILAVDPNNEVAGDYVGRLVKKGVKRSSAQDSSPVSESDMNEAGRLAAGIALYEGGEYQRSKDFFEDQMKKNSLDNKAREWFEKVRTEQSEKAEKHYNLGLVAYSEGRVDAAIKEWRETIKISPYHAATLRVLNKVSEGSK
jgi:tetratricopeptide (TPR) repeat protein